MGVRRGRMLRRLLTYTLLLIGVGIVLFPFWYMVVTSFKPQTFIFEMPPRLWPQAVTLRNYTAALDTDQFGGYFLNSLKVALATTATTLVVASLLAYAFSRLQFPGRRWLFYVLLLGMMIPPVMLIIPQFIVAKTLHLRNHLGLILIYASMNLAMQTYLLRGFFEALPVDLEDAARIDGASNWMIFWRILLPLSRPALAVGTIFTFFYSWDEFPLAHVLVSETSERTLPIAIALFQSAHLTEWGQVFAASIVGLIPVVIVFALFQRHLIRGIATTGLKG